MYDAKRSPGARCFDLMNVAMMLLLCVIMVYPLLYEALLSLSEPAQLFGYNGFLIRPRGFTWSNYQRVFSNERILTGLKNTMFLMTVRLGLNMIMTAIGAYFLTRTKTMLFKPVMLMMLITMYFGGGLIPSYINVKELGLINTLWALVLPNAVSTYNVIMLRSFFRTIPESMVESVEIDGGGHLTILFRVFIPLSTAAMAVIVLYYGVSIWNSWFDAKIYLQDSSKYPLQLVLQRMLTENTADLGIGTDMYYEQLSETIKAATVMVVTLPILVLYPFLQKYFVSGVMIGSLKE